MGRYINSIDDLSTIHLDHVAIVQEYVRPSFEYLNLFIYFDLSEEEIVAKMLESLNNSIDQCKLLVPRKVGHDNSEAHIFSPDILQLRPLHEEIRATMFVLKQYLNRTISADHNLPPAQELFSIERPKSKVRLFGD